MQNFETPRSWLDEALLSQSSLFIQLEVGAVVFTLFDSKSNQYIFLKQSLFSVSESPVERLSRLIATDALLQRTYLRIVIVLKEGASTLVPAEFVERETVAAFAELNFGKQEGKRLKLSRLRKWGMVNLFLADEERHETLTRLFPEANVLHITTPLLYRALRENYAGVEFYLEIASNAAWAVVVKEGKLLFCNGFEFNGEEELAYHAVNFYRQLKLDREIVPLILSGNIDNNGLSAEVLGEFFAYISYAETPDAFSYIPHLRTLLAHEHSTFLSLPLCE